MPDVRMSDGTIIKNVPEGTTKQQLLQKLGRVPQETAPEAAPEPQSSAQADPSFFEAFGRASVLRFLENMAAPAELMGRALTPDPRRHGPIEAAAALTKLVTGGAVDPAASAEANRQAITGSLSGENLAAASRFVGQMPPSIATGQPMQSFPDLQAQEKELSRQAAEQAPVGTAIGGAAGDIATLLTARAPIRAPLTAATMPSRAALTAESTLGKALQATARAVRPALARTAETGAEAAVLAAIQGNDPATVGALAAGIQGGNDLLVGGVKKLLKSPAIAGGIGGAVLTASILSNGFQQLIPGGLDRILPTVEGHSKEAVLALLLGGTGQAVLGRFGPKAFSAGKAGPVVSEIANVVRRGALISGLNALVKDFGTVGPVASAFSEDPNAFGPKAKVALQKAFNGQSDLGKTITNLMKDPAFKKQFDALNDMQ